jgi:hypothetical protein
MGLEKTNMGNLPLYRFIRYHDTVGVLASMWIKPGKSGGKDSAVPYRSGCILGILRYHL